MFAEYNAYMGGTDLCDQRRGNFSTQRRSKKWWHALFYFTLDVLMVSNVCYVHTLLPHTCCACVQLNSWAVFNWQNGTNMTHKDFIVNVAITGLKEIDPENIDVYDPSRSMGEPDSDLLSPAAKETPPAQRFVCKREDPASIPRSRKYK